MISPATHSDEVEIDILEGPQHGFGGRVVGGPDRIVSIQAGKFFTKLGQMAAGDMLEQGQKTDANRKQARQASGVAIVLQVHRGQAQRLAFQSTETMLHQVFLVVSQDGIWQRESAFRAVGAIDPPSQAADGFLGGLLIALNAQGQLREEAGFCRMPPYFRMCCFCTWALMRICNSS
jgi:hypothetical protein